MSDHKPITGELRCHMVTDETCSRERLVYYLCIDEVAFVNLCDAIDAIHAQLERENAALRERVSKMDNRDGSMHIAEATVTITPTLDWSGVARELRAIADTLAGDAE